MSSFWPFFHIQMAFEKITVFGITLKKSQVFGNFRHSNVNFAEGQMLTLVSPVCTSGGGRHTSLGGFLWNFHHWDWDHHLQQDPHWPPGHGGGHRDHSVWPVSATAGVPKYTENFSKKSQICPIWGDYDPISMPNVTSLEGKWIDGELIVVFK